MVKEEEMGSTVVIYRDENHPENETLWMPNSGLFFRTMQAMSNIVQDSNPQFSKELKQYCNNPHSYIDMSKWNSEKLKKFLKVVIRLEKNVISHLIELQKSDVHLQTIVGLKLLLNIDPRIEGEKAYLKSGSIILDDATKWKTSGWLLHLQTCKLQVSRLIHSHRIVVRHSKLISMSTIQVVDQQAHQVH